MQWAIPGISNPRELITTGTFNVSIYDKSQKLLYFYNITDVPVVAMTEYRTPNAIDYTRSTYENGKPSNYSWRVVASNYLTAGDQFVWTMPHPIVFSPNSTILGTSYWLKGEQPTSINGAQNELTMTVTISTSLRRQLAADYFLQN